jgi:hypothetical protein
MAKSRSTINGEVIKRGIPYCSVRGVRGSGTSSKPSAAFFNHCPYLSDEHLQTAAKMAAAPRLKQPRGMRALDHPDDILC